MIDVATPHDGDRLEAAVGVLRKSRHDVAVVHPPALAALEVLPNVAPGERRRWTKTFIAFRVAVDVVNAEQKRIVGLPARLERRDTDKLNRSFLDVITFSVAGFS